MELSSIAVRNFRSLVNTGAIPLGSFTYIIGENNSGKSSFLRAYDVFYSGSSLTSSDFNDTNKSIRIEVAFRDINDDDMLMIANDEHRRRIKEILSDGCINLVRIYDSGGKSSLKYRCLLPIDERFSNDYIRTRIVPTGSKPAEIRKNLLLAFPELADTVPASPSQTQAKALIDELTMKIPDNEKEIADNDLPTGFDKSIIPLLPEPIYIPAVRDFSEDVKTKQAASFGKILSLLSDILEPQLGEMEEHFRSLDRMLNTTEMKDGNVVDERNDMVRKIETLIDRNVKSSFGSVDIRLQFSNPDLRTILGGGVISANDGVIGHIDTKGDGLRRAVIFSILRTYVEMKSSKRNRISSSNEGSKAKNKSYVILFEEPELYLHPRAQMILYKSLKEISNSNYVVASTHSPYFLKPSSDEVFIKIRRQRNNITQREKGSVLKFINIDNIRTKDQMQIINYENGNAAFFSSNIVLVEGDSDLLVFPHIAKTLNEDWGRDDIDISYVQIRGKGSIKKYKEFYSVCDSKVFVIADLDLILKDFDKVDPDERLNRVRSDLLQRIDRISGLDSGVPLPTGSQVRDARRRITIIDLFESAKRKYEQYRESKDEADFNASIEEMKMVFEFNKDSIRKEYLIDEEDQEIRDLKNELLRLLREKDVFVLSKGEIERYYPDDVVGSDKPTKAYSYCSVVDTREKILGLCPSLKMDGDTERAELEVIFESIYGSLV